MEALLAILICIAAIFVICGVGLLLGWLSTQLLRFAPLGVLAFTAVLYGLSAHFVVSEDTSSELALCGTGAFFDTVGFVTMALGFVAGCVIGLVRLDLLGAAMAAFLMAWVTLLMPSVSPCHDLTAICSSSLAMLVVSERKCSPRTLLLTAGLGALVMLAREPGWVPTFLLSFAPFVVVAVACGQMFQRHGRCKQS